MRHHFDPDEVQVLCRAFDTAWGTLEKEVRSVGTDAIREHMGRAIVRMAMHGELSETRLASHAAYKGQIFMGIRAGSIVIRDTAKT